MKPNGFGFLKSLLSSYNQQHQIPEGHRQSLGYQWGKVFLLVMDAAMGFS
jgi:hypothetical protein